MGITAENIAEGWEITREEQDEFALNSQLKTEKQLLNLAGSENPDLERLGLTLIILLTSKQLHLTIEGTPVIPSQDGTIAESYFDSESCPGAFKKDGKIDSIAAKIILERWLKH